MRHSREKESADGMPSFFWSRSLSIHSRSSGCSVSPRPFSLPLRSTLMQSEDMRRRRRRRRCRRHDPVVDHPEDASCKNKRTGSLGMSRDSVLYRSPAYIDTNLCPPQAVLCICRIYIHTPPLAHPRFPSLSLSLSPLSATPRGPLPLFRSWFLPFPSSPPVSPCHHLSARSCSVSLSVSESIRSRPTLSRSLAGPARGGFPNTHTEEPEVCTRVCVAPPPGRHHHRQHHPRRPSVRGAVRVCGGGWDRAHSRAHRWRMC